MYGFTTPISEADKIKFEQGWTREMANYFRERMLRLKIYDTGALYRSVATSYRGKTIEIKFLEYGLYVAKGVGKGYTPGNQGNIDALKDWKHTQNRHRQRRDWFHPKLYSSLRTLGEFESAFYVDAYQGMTVEAVKQLFEGK